MQILQRKDDFTSKRMNVSTDYYDVTIDFKNIPKARGCADVTIEFSVKGFTDGTYKIHGARVRNIKYMVTVLKYQRYWARVRKRDRRRGLPSLLPRFRPEPKYR